MDNTYKPYEEVVKVFYNDLNDSDTVKHGLWIPWISQNSTGLACSECGYPSNAAIGYGTRYCPRCGTKMDNASPD